MKRAALWRRPAAWGLAGAVALGSVCAPATMRHLRAAALLLGAIGVDVPFGLARPWVLALGPVREGVLQLSDRSLRARWYAPRDLARAPGVVLFHGIHHLGIDEPRFCRMARALAGAGYRVLTPELTELNQYRIEPATIDTIALAIMAHAHATGGKVGAWGISFAGGLLLLAATRPVVGQALTYVVTVGAHADLMRVARYFSGESVFAPDGTGPLVEPHPYGARVLLHAYVDRLFDPQTAEVARRALRLYVEDRFEEARAAAHILQGDARERLLRLLEGDKTSIGRDLMPVAAQEQARWAEVSPHGQLAALRTPTFLLHGRGDSVIPSLETRYLAQEVPKAALREVLVTPVLGHADLSQTLPWRDYLELVSFTASILHTAAF